MTADASKPELTYAIFVVVIIFVVVFNTLILAMVMHEAQSMLERYYAEKGYDVRQSMLHADHHVEAPKQVESIDMEEVHMRNLFLFPITLLLRL
jgi:hypothetical protein